MRILLSHLLDNTEQVPALGGGTSLLRTGIGVVTSVVSGLGWGSNIMCAAGATSRSSALTQAEPPAKELPPGPFTYGWGGAICNAGH